MSGKIENAKFGDIIENEWASETNPRRVGIYIGKKSNYLKTISLTDGNGDVWNLINDDSSRSVVIGNAFEQHEQELARTKEAVEKLEYVYEKFKIVGYKMEHVEVFLEEAKKEREG